MHGVWRLEKRVHDYCVNRQLLSRILQFCFGDREERLKGCSFLLCFVLQFLFLCCFADKKKKRESKIWSFLTFLLNFINLYVCELSSFVNMFQIDSWRKRCMIQKKKKKKVCAFLILCRLYLVYKNMPLINGIRNML